MLLLSRHQLVVRIRNDLGDHIGAIDKAPAGLVVRIYRHDVGLGTIILADHRERDISKLKPERDTANMPGRGEQSVVRQPRQSGTTR